MARSDAYGGATQEQKQWAAERAAGHTAFRSTDPEWTISREGTRRSQVERDGWIGDPFSPWCYSEIAHYVVTGLVPDFGDARLQAYVAELVATDPQGNGNERKGEEFWRTAPWDDVEQWRGSGFGPRKTEYQKWRADWQERWWEHCLACWDAGVVAILESDPETGEVFFGARSRAFDRVESVEESDARAREKDARMVLNRAATARGPVSPLAARAHRGRQGTIDEAREQKRDLEARYGFATEDDPIKRDATWRRIADVIRGAK